MGCTEQCGLTTRKPKKAFGEMMNAMGTVRTIMPVPIRRRLGKMWKMTKEIWSWRRGAKLMNPAG